MDLIERGASGHPLIGLSDLLRVIDFVFAAVNCGKNIKKSAHK
jgi:hypothetical protein